MKKEIRYLVIICGMIAVLAFGWLYAYHHTKNVDNLPALESLQVDDLKELTGYQKMQLISIWGEPDDTISVNQDVWNLENEVYLLVTYGKNGKVKEAVFAIP